MVFLEDLNSFDVFVLEAVAFIERHRDEPSSAQACDDCDIII